MTASSTVGIDAAIFNLPREERYLKLLASEGTGLQSSLFAEARDVVRQVLAQKLQGAATIEGVQPSATKTSVLVAYTSNLISSGLRETFASMANLKVADAFVSTAGGIEEDVIKCLGDTLVGDFALRGSDLRLQGLNRVGNLLIPNDNYINFEAFFVPVVKKLHQQQLESDWALGTSPSALIRLMGIALESPESDQHLQPSPLSEEELKEVRAKLVDGDEELVAGELTRLGLDKTRRQSLVCCCATNNIPMYCPALTDGSMGDMICFYSFNKKGFVCDPAADHQCLVDLSSAQDHHILVIALGAGLPRNHALHMTPPTGTYVTAEGRTITVRRTIVQIVTGLDIDGCNSGAQLKEDIAEGLLTSGDRVIRVHGDAALLFPLMVGGL